MATISTKRGDKGETGLSDGTRVSKGDLRIEASGCIHELKTMIGLARAWCDDAEVNAIAKSMQRELFLIGAAVSAKPGGKYEIPIVEKALVDRLDAIGKQLEAQPGLIQDWTISGELRGAAAFDVAGTVCRRAERNVVRLVTAGERIAPTVLEYLNRLSDVLWLLARTLELRAGVDSRLRDEAHPGPPWSRAW